MKKRKFFELLNKEIDDIIPPLSEKIKNETINVSSRAESENPISKNRVARRIPRAVFACILLLVFCIPPVLFLFRDAPAQKTGGAILNISINPSVTLLLDEDLNVTRAISENADGDTLLGDESFVGSLIGADAQTAAALISERAALMGYVKSPSDEECKEINLTITSTDGANKELGESISDKIVSRLSGMGVSVRTNMQYVKDEQIKAKIDNYKLASTYFFERIEELEELIRYAETAIYEYAGDLLKYSLARYELYTAIYQANEQIEQEYSLTYWESADDAQNASKELFVKISSALEKLKNVYGEDFTEHTPLTAFRFKAAYGAYMASVALADVDALKTLSNEGISAETFGGIKNISVRANYFSFVSCDLLRRIVSEIFSDYTPSPDDSEYRSELTENIKSMTRDFAQFKINLRQELD